MNLSQQDLALLGAVLPANTSATHFKDFRCGHDDLARLLAAARAQGADQSPEAGNMINKPASPRVAPYTAIFNAIGDAARQEAVGLAISVQRFEDSLLGYGYGVTPINAASPERVISAEMIDKAARELNPSAFDPFSTADIFWLSRWQAEAKVSAAKALCAALECTLESTRLRVPTVEAVPIDAPFGWTPGQAMTVVQTNEPGHWSLDWKPDQIVYFAGWSWDVRKGRPDVWVSDRWPPKSPGDISDGWDPLDLTAASPPQSADHVSDAGKMVSPESTVQSLGDAS